jgi:NhaA family Na+:H+ antiporter
MACTLVALFLANGFLHDQYEHLLHTEIEFAIGRWEIRHTLHHWINDGLMALFFMVVGLEIKREIITGELSDPKAAILPVVAAVGGMVVPAVLFYAINAGGPGAMGWGVPMATDIAFAVSVLVLLGSRIPKTVLTFLVGLAIVDDLGAVLVIAIFYNKEIATNWLGMAGLAFLLLVVLNRLGVRKPLPYFVVGIGMWFAMLQSGVHATLAGVLTALTIPVWPKYNHKLFVEHMETLLDEIRNNPDAGVRTGGLRGAMYHSRQPLPRPAADPGERGSLGGIPTAAAGTRHAHPGGLPDHAVVRPGQCRYTDRYGQRWTVLYQPGGHGGDDGPVAG